MAEATLASPKPPGRAGRAPSLEKAELYFNREISWLKFNERVLEEVFDGRNPLLERVRFLSIFFANLDEFYMIRVSGLRRQLASGVVEGPPDGMTTADQLATIRAEVEPVLDRALTAWHLDLVPDLARQGLHVVEYEALGPNQRRLLRATFKREIFPVLTPLAFDPGHPFPHISNLSVNLAVVVLDQEHGERFARVKVPGSISRLLLVPAEADAGELERLGQATLATPYVVFLEEVIEANLDLLFPGVEVAASYPFRVTRDADLEIEEDEAADLLEAMSEVVGQRHFGSAVRLETDEKMPQRVRDVLLRNLELAPFQMVTTRGPLGLADVEQLVGLDRPDLKYPPFVPVARPQLGRDENLFDAIRRRDVLLYHPYDSFNAVVGFLTAAARDPDVLAIKQTLYRVGAKSPIVQELMEARERGKQVSALVELKARFDEQNNIVWARAMEQAGVHVVYGVLGLKTHAKICLVVRREKDGIRRYVHLGTGNYNPITARVYTDLGLFTCDPAIADDVSDLFNALTGYSNQKHYQKLLVAPVEMRQQLLGRIRREIRQHEEHGGGHLAFKMNSLVDKECIQALYKASRAGVRVDLQIRGICCLRPGLPGISENVRVTSIVGRFLEHSRIFYFRNGGDDEILLGSPDLMPRNLGGRVEVLFPVEDPALRAALRDDVLFLHLKDNQKARLLLPDGTYTHIGPAEGEAPLASQDHLLARGGGWRLQD